MNAIVRVLVVGWVAPLLWALWDFGTGVLLVIGVVFLSRSNIQAVGLATIGAGFWRLAVAVHVKRRVHEA